MAPYQLIELLMIALKGERPFFDIRKPIEHGLPRRRLGKGGSTRTIRGRNKTHPKNTPDITLTVNTPSLSEKTREADPGEVFSRQPRMILRYARFATCVN